jgi:hypothetical protein
MVRISSETLLDLYLFAIIFNGGFKTPGAALLLSFLKHLLGNPFLSIR